MFINDRPKERMWINWVEEKKKKKKNQSDKRMYLEPKKSLILYKTANITFCATHGERKLGRNTCPF